MKFQSVIIALMVITGHPFSNAQQILDQYVAHAVENNLLVKEKQSIERKQHAALAHAGKVGGPEVRFLTQYLVAGGGRTIDLPIGLLLNDVYSTLNGLIREERFQPIQDETVTFLPNHFYDARFRITQPILRPEIKYNKLIKKEETALAGLQTAETVRDLIRDVKTAYMQWMQAREAIAIIDHGLTLLQENKRITESLIRNGMALPSALMRIESETEKVNAQKQKAETDLGNAASYFHFLLRQPDGSVIMEDSGIGIPDIPSTADMTLREEWQQLETGRRIQELALQLERKQHTPTLGLQLEVGSQAFAPDWGGYYLGAVQLEIPLWDNRKSRLKQQEWKALIEATTARQQWTQSAFEVQWQTAVNSLRSDIALYHSYTSQVATNRRLYDETLRRYKEGMANYIELLDARTQVTQTQLEQNLAKYKAWMRRVEIERYSN